MEPRKPAGPNPFADVRIMDENTPSSKLEPQKTEPKYDSAGNIKELIESILVAFILAFIFRAFVVEAFVIPTGSMATTLLGAHMRFTCQDCGYRFDTNYPAGEDVSIPSFAASVDDIHCPNCGYLVQRRTAAVTRELGGNGTTLHDTPAVFYGDRILVLKYLYLFQDPSRWDVVVFKSPTDPKFEMNFIKRLIGKPGETIMVLDGDVYVAHGDASWLPLEAEIQKQTQVAEKARLMLESDADDSAKSAAQKSITVANDRKFAAQVSLASKFNVQSKPRVVQEAMWRLVYNNDFAPQGLPRSGTSAWKQPWTPTTGTGWSTGNAAADRNFKFENSTGDGMLAFQPDQDSQSQSTTDFVTYDVPHNRRNAPYNEQTMSAGHEENVSDLNLRLIYKRSTGDGPLWLRLKKRDVQFTAEIGPNYVKLMSKTGGGEEKQIGATVPLQVKPDVAMQIEFSNVDYRVSLVIDDKEMIASTPTDYAPDIQNLLAEYNADRLAPEPSVSIGAAQQACTISHLSLWRDVYYTNKWYFSKRKDLNRPLWSSPADYPNQLMKLGPDEFFVLGDNSVISGDARGWSERIDLPGEKLTVEAGRVPARFMLGKAFFVYWPAGYRPFSAGPAFTPNFGAMRFIH